MMRDKGAAPLTMKQDFLFEEAMDNKKKKPRDFVCDIMTPEQRRLQTMKKPMKTTDNDALAMAAVMARVKETREKPFNSKSVAELIEHSHLGTPLEQFNIGIELEQKIRETVSSLVSKAFGRADETYSMVSRLNNKINNLDALYKTDSDRLSELSRLDKQVERLGINILNSVSRVDTCEDCIDKLTNRITWLDSESNKRIKFLEKDQKALRDWVE